MKIRSIRTPADGWQVTILPPVVLSHIKLVETAPSGRTYVREDWQQPANKARTHTMCRDTRKLRVAWMTLENRTEWFHVDLEYPVFATPNPVHRRPKPLVWDTDVKPAATELAEWKAGAASGEEDDEYTEEEKQWLAGKALAEAAKENVALAAELAAILALVPPRG